MNRRSPLAEVQLHRIYKMFQDILIHPVYPVNLPFKKATAKR
jgi:hypothetical protein